MSQLGVIEPMSAPFAVSWDRIAQRNEVVDFEPIDLGWIGEDAEGIWSKRHIEAALAEDQQAQEILTVWNGTTDRALRRDDLGDLSAWEVDAWRAMLAAHDRERVRRGKPTIEEGETGGA
jgi:hypothetical protein